MKTHKKNFDRKHSQSKCNAPHPAPSFYRPRSIGPGALALCPANILYIPNPCAWVHGARCEPSLNDRPRCRFSRAQNNIFRNFVRSATNLFYRPAPMTSEPGAIPARFTAETSRHAHVRMHHRKCVFACNDPPSFVATRHTIYNIVLLLCRTVCHYARFYSLIFFFHRTDKSFSRYHRFFFPRFYFPGG